MHALVRREVAALGAGEHASRVITTVRAIVGVDAVVAVEVAARRAPKRTTLPIAFELGRVSGAHSRQCVSESRTRIKFFKQNNE